MSLVTGLSSPVDLTNAGDGSGRLFVVERVGRIRIIESGVLSAQGLSLPIRVEFLEDLENIRIISFGYNGLGAQESGAVKVAQVRAC